MIISDTRGSPNLMRGSSQEHFRMLGTSARGLIKREKRIMNANTTVRQGGRRTKMGNLQELYLSNISILNGKQHTIVVA